VGLLDGKEGMGSMVLKRSKMKGDWVHGEKRVQLALAGTLLARRKTPGWEAVA